MNDYQILIEHYIELHKYINDNIFHLDDKVIKENFNWGSILKFGLIGIGIIGLIVVLLKTFTNNISNGSLSSGSSSNNSSESDNKELKKIQEQLNDLGKQSEEVEEQQKKSIYYGSNIIIEAKKQNNEEIINIINKTINKYKNESKEKIEYIKQQLIDKYCIDFNLLLENDLNINFEQALNKINLLNIENLYKASELLQKDFPDIYRTILKLVYNSFIFSLLIPFLILKSEVNIIENNEINSNENYIYDYNLFRKKLNEIYNNIKNNITDQNILSELKNIEIKHLANPTQIATYTASLAYFIGQVLGPKLEEEKITITDNKNKKILLNSESFPKFNDNFKSNLANIICQVLTIITIQQQMFTSIIEIYKIYKNQYIDPYLNDENYNDPFSLKSEFLNNEDE